ncbi:branched-chain amino acid ABC transporter permease [Tardiphaga sp. 42S5]|jgi:branched-chain amino acid transport system permease protein|uniref:branched-chain amino acid ABC transporter permease n=1 Tax=unclassified Tardiphaga TaxID=2631404 RepID=UPI002A59FBF7|nr:branched-chain amino acid ABC transporter permease [Tardiphaga sp. 42S5]WPO40959.1 branched-chain amino acid ABC transporter permease [Tardiphaga sp. 42S5]
MTNAVLTGLVLGGMYALIAMGLTLQYGVARIMNLSYGEFLIGAAFASYWLFTGWALNPLAGLAFVIPISFGISYLLYRVLLTPLVRRARTRDALEVDSILATFGMMFIVQGIMLTMFGGAYFSYSFLAVPVTVVGEVLALNRLIAFGLAVVVGLALYLTLTRTRIGTSIRAVAVDPIAAQLVAIDVTRTSALAFALGGALVASAGVLISMFLTFSATSGVVFTMKALIVVVMGGVGNLLGCLVAGLALGLSEALVATFIDPGLTLAVNFALFLGVLLVKPAGIFGRAQR